MLKKLLIALAVVALGLFVAVAAFFYMLDDALTPASLSSEQRSLGDQARSNLLADIPASYSPSVEVLPSKSEQPRIKVKLKPKDPLSWTDLAEAIDKSRIALDQHTPTGWRADTIETQSQLSPTGQKLFVYGSDTAALPKLRPYTEALPADTMRLNTETQTLTYAVTLPKEKTNNTEIECAADIRELGNSLQKVAHPGDGVTLQLALWDCIQREGSKDNPTLDLIAHADTLKSQVDSLATFAERSSFTHEFSATALPDNTLIVREPIYPNSKPASPDRYQELWPNGQVVIDYNDIRIHPDGSWERR